MLIPLIVLAAVFILIAIRQISGINLRIWQIVLAGALIVLSTGQISIYNAVASINLDVMVFLFSVFVIGQALEESGYLAHVTSRIFSKAKTPDALLILILLVMGISSAVLMNDTIAVIGTPVVLMLSQEHRIGPKPMLLALAFAVTIGSAMSPIGNPQNLLISISSNLPNPFITFFTYLIIPTLINLAIAYFVIKHFYKSHFHKTNLVHRRKEISDAHLANLSKLSISIMVLLIAAKILFAFVNPSLDQEFDISYIPLIAAMPIILLSNSRLKILKNIDWHTLVFFASLFVLIQSVWLTNFFQTGISNLNLDLGSIPVILTVSVLLSQLISNVPFAALYSHLLGAYSLSGIQVAALAAGSTIAGNLLILGAASNIIIIQNAEKRTKDTITFLEFASIGIILTVLNVAVYWVCLSLAI